MVIEFLLHEYQQYLKYHDFKDKFILTYTGYASLRWPQSMCFYVRPSEVIALFEEGPFSLLFMRYIFLMLYLYYSISKSKELNIFHNSMT